MIVRRENVQHDDDDDVYVYNYLEIFVAPFVLEELLFPVPIFYFAFEVDVFLHSFLEAPFEESK